MVTFLSLSNAQIITHNAQILNQILVKRYQIVILLVQIVIQLASLSQSHTKVINRLIFSASI